MGRKSESPHTVHRSSTIPPPPRRKRQLKSQANDLVVKTRHYEVQVGYSTLAWGKASTLTWNVIEHTYTYTCRMRELDLGLIGRDS
ncbi:hypothetical protein M8J76_009699 [Diaphorina citri]|nr:hypothetical protein M8J75_007036 [Diaphorina citri]KAI5737058.1 hypothetical protein M8J76_009699 [Diaphorina citri]